MLSTNLRKPLRLKNNTKFFKPSVSRSHNVFSSQSSYQTRQIKIEGYETRLYWQFRYCEDHNGQTFFYTLTYNDKALPKHYGINCFDYEDLRDLLTGGFRKQLLRKYGTTFKYFIGAELGDGKGERGMHNNPHYHILFFLEPANNERFPYSKISPEDFRTLVRKYWQGFDEDKDGYHDYNEALYGIAREGENCGLVTDFRACCYVSKYVCKDAKLVMKEKDVRRLTAWNVKKTKSYNAEYCEWFFHNVIYELFNEPLDDDRTRWLLDDKQLIYLLVPKYFDVFDEVQLHDPKQPQGQQRTIGKKEFFEKYWQAPTEDKDYVPIVYEICRKKKIWKAYNNYFSDFIHKKVEEAVAEWRNRYSNKVRCSQGVGAYGLEHIQDKMNPTIQVPSKKGFKNRPLPMYYYRKLYMDIVQDSHGMNHYVLNDLGQEYKISQLPKQIKKIKTKATAHLDLIVSNPELFEKMRQSDVNTEVWLHHSEFLRKLNYLLEDENKDEILQRYAEYKLVYKDRFFSYQADGNYGIVPFPDISVVDDYRRFLVPTIYSVSRSDLRYTKFFENGCPNFLPYASHPYFLRYIGIFGVLDLCADYFFVQGDAKKQTEAEEIARTKRFHTERKVKEFYAAFCN